MWIIISDIFLSVEYESVDKGWLLRFEKNYIKEAKNDYLNDQFSKSYTTGITIFFNFINVKVSTFSFKIHFNDFFSAI